MHISHDEWSIFANVGCPVFLKAVRVSLDSSAVGAAILGVQRQGSVFADDKDNGNKTNKLVLVRLELFGS